MMILLLFLQKQNLAFGVYLFGSVLSFKRDDGPGAEPDDGEEVCPGGNARPRWRSADAQVGAGNGGGSSGKETSTHHLFPSKLVKKEDKAGADDGGAHAQGATIGTPGGGTQQAQWSPYHLPPR